MLYAPNTYNLVLSPLKTGNPYTGTLAKSEKPNEMPHKAAFQQGLHCLLRQIRSSIKMIIILYEHYNL